MPKETKYKLDDMNNNMKEKAQYYEQDHQTNNDPNPCAERKA